MSALIAVTCFVTGTTLNLLGEHLLGMILLTIGWVCYLAFAMDNK